PVAQYPRTGDNRCVRRQIVYMVVVVRLIVAMDTVQDDALRLLVVPVVTRGTRKLGQPLRDEQVSINISGARRLRAGTVIRGRPKCARRSRVSDNVFYNEILRPLCYLQDVVSLSEVVIQKRIGP